MFLSTKDLRKPLNNTCDKKGIFIKAPINIRTMQRQVRGLISPYVGFLVDKLDKIYDAWDAQEEELALSRAIRLSYFLVEQLKEKLKPDVKQILEEMNKATAVEKTGFLSQENVKNWRAKDVARKWLPIFLDKLTSLFDERDYFEIHPRPLPLGGEGISPAVAEE